MVHTNNINNIYVHVQVCKPKLVTKRVVAIWNKYATNLENVAFRGKLKIVQPL